MLFHHFIALSGLISYSDDTDTHTDTDIVYFDNNSIVNPTKYTTHSTYEIDIVTI